ncbi:MAG: hypothetical protein ACE5GD_10720 [Candidatus Geothermarchaeales archaeon]
MKKAHFKSIRRNLKDLRGLLNRDAHRPPPGTRPSGYPERSPSSIGAQGFNPESGGRK